jgi:hypothetical protein
LNGMLDGSGEIKLRETTLLKIIKDRRYYALAVWRDTSYWTTRLTKDHACDMRPVNRHRSPASRILHQGVQSPNIGAIEAGVREVHRAIENAHAYLGLAERGILQ